MITVSSHYLKPEYLHINTTKNIALFCDVTAHPKDINNLENCIKILYLVEPYSIMPATRDYAFKYHKMYDYVITYDEELLSKLPNVKFLHYGTTWIPETYYNSVDITKKIFNISCVVGDKTLTDGHNLRIKLFHRQSEIKVPATFFISYYSTKLPNINNNPKLLDSKIPLFDTHKYSVIIENSRQANYFTEKLIDCLLTKTIPIYFGCPNINAFFDTTGWIILENDNCDQIIGTLNNMTDEYDENQSTVKLNYTKAQKYTNLLKDLSELITELVK